MLDWLSRQLDRAAMAAAAALGAVMATALLAQVVFRFVLEHPLSWSEELARYCFVWVGMLGASGGIRRGLHPSLDLLAARLPGRPGAWLRGAALLAAVAFGGLVTYYGAALALFNMRQRSPAMDLPMGVPYAAVPAAGLLMTVHLVARLLGRDRPAA